VAERLANEVISLPLFPAITEEQIERVVSAVRSFYEGGSQA
jgi:dTDP-4-amino-4,6-dideoxygalactose transaminase